MNPYLARLVGRLKTHFKLLGLGKNYELKNQPKYFVIGFNKTGTTSVKIALEELDLRVGHQRHAELLMRSVIKKRYKALFKYCKTAQAFQDVPFSRPGVFKVLDEEFPNSKFILTIRDDAEQWFNSVTKFHSKLFGKGKLPNLTDLKEAEYVHRGWIYMTHIDTFGSDLYNKDRYEKIYERHNADVIEFFKNRKDDLLVINVARENSYQLLCQFLGKAPLRQAFEWSNRTSEIR